MKADYTDKSEWPQIAWNGDNRQMKADYTRWS